MTVGRRDVVRGTLALTGAALSGTALAQAGSLFTFTSDDGRQVYNYRLPSEVSVEGLPGVVWAGAGQPDVVLLEYFDYNCPYCARAEREIDALVCATPGLRLGLVNDPILGVGSFQAAKVQQAVLRTAGPARAYAFHRAVYAERGPVDGRLALAVAGEIGLDTKAVEAAADLPQVGAVIGRHVELAASLGFDATPSFSLGNVGILGYPGPKALGRAVADMKACDKLACG